jgi:2-polyprenyl-3-methyl-5-hydroxy-6-metoxy-1,4-benzoquinol methylase
VAGKMTTNSTMVDRSREMDEKSWWDLWNTSHRVKDDNDAISSELFARAAMVVNEITRRAKSRVLEIACGTGTLSRMISYSHYIGLDISPAAIEVAQEKSKQAESASGGNPPSYEAADFHNWLLPDQPFDLVICIDAISSIRDQEVAMRKFARALRPGGQLVITTINRFVYNRIRRNAAVRLESGPVSHWLSRAELNSLVREAGLVIDKSYTIMPRGDMGILRIVNSPRLNRAFGPGVEAALKRAKEQRGFGQYSVVVAHKV